MMAIILGVACVFSTHPFSDLQHSHELKPPNLMQSGNRCLSVQWRECLNCNGPPVGSICKLLYAAALWGLSSERGFILLDCMIGERPAPLEVVKVSLCSNKKAWGSKFIIGAFLAVVLYPPPPQKIFCIHFDWIKWLWSLPANIYNFQMIAGWPSNCRLFSMSYHISNKLYYFPQLNQGTMAT